MTVVDRDEPTAPSTPPAPPAHEGRRIAAGLALALGTAVLFALSMPPFGLWILIWVAFVPMVVAQHRVLPARWSSLAVGAALGGIWASQLSRGLAEAEVAFVFQLLPLYVALLATGVAWRSRRFQERTRYALLAFSFPVAWTAIDFVRANASEVAAGTWLNPSYALWDLPAFLQPLGVFGLFGLELLVLVVNWAIAACVLWWLDRGRLSGPRVPARVAAVGLVVALAGVALWGGASALMMRDPAPDVRVAVVQPGDTDGWREEYARDVEQTREAAADDAELVVWREGGLRVDPQDSDITESLRALVRETGVYLAIGYRYTRDDGSKVNEATVLAPDGTFLGRFGKDHPGDFAGDHSDTGGDYPVYDTPIGNLATIICYDLDFTDTARKMARKDAQLVGVPSNDVTTDLAYTHYTHLVFRAIENRMAMAKADSLRDSAIIDPYGRVLAKRVTPDGGRATLVADVALGTHDSPYVALGDWVGWCCLLATAGLLAWSFTMQVRARRRGATAAR